MKRTLKNILNILLIIVLACAMILVYSYAKNYSAYTYVDEDLTVENDNSTEQTDSTLERSVNIIAVSYSNSNNGTIKFMDSTTTTPPDKPEGDGSENGSNGDPGESNGSQPSDKPSDTTGDQAQDVPSDISGDTPTLEGDGSGSEDSALTVPENGGEMDIPTMPGMDEMTMVNSSAPWYFYLAFGFLGLLLGISIMYLFLSGFNKKTFKETFVNKAKIAVIILAGFVLSLALTFGMYIVLAGSGSAVVNPGMNENMTEPGDMDMGGNTQNSGSGNSNNNSNITYSAANEITEDETVDKATYTSENSDENALMVSGDIEVTLENIEVSKEGDSDGGDDTSFYGINSGIIAKDGAVLNISNATIVTEAVGGNGVFSYGGSATTSNTSSDGTTVNISDSKITTSEDNSGGIMTTGGGITNASNLEVETSGTSSAAIRTDRGGGTVNVTGGTYVTNGQGSPAIYSTADVTVSDAKLIANTSEGIIIEGKNSVTIDNVELTDSNTKLNGQSTSYKNIFIYQSMSGDADTGLSYFKASNSYITTNKGDTIYVTNTACEIDLENNTIINNDSDGNFLRAKADSWGSTGSNGGDVTLNMTNQIASGNIEIDSVSTLVMNMEGSTYKGTINSGNNAKSIEITLDKDSSITLTGDSYVTSFEDEDSTYSNINFNGYSLYVNGTKIN